LSPNTPEADSYSDVSTAETTESLDLPTCEDCGLTYLHTTSGGPGQTKRSCGCSTTLDLVTDRGVPDSLEELAATCESCGGDVEPQYLEDGECPGCVYGEPVTDGGVDKSERFLEIVERGQSTAEPGEPEFQWSRVEGVYAYEDDKDRAEELLQEIIDADGPTADTAQQALNVLTDSTDQQGDTVPPLTTDWWHLTGFQRDILRILGLEGGMYGLAIKSELEDRYDVEVNHGRLYPNLDDLVEDGAVVKSQLDKRTNLYELTAAGEGLVAAQKEAWSELALDEEPVRQPDAEPERDTESAAATDGGSTTTVVGSPEQTLEVDGGEDEESEEDEEVLDPYEAFDESPMPARIDLLDVLEVVTDSSTVYDAAAELDVSSEKLATLLWDLGLKRPQTKVIVDNVEERVEDIREIMNGGESA